MYVVILILFDSQLQIFFKFWISWVRQEGSLLNVLEHWENEGMETFEEAGSTELSKLYPTKNHKKLHSRVLMLDFNISPPSISECLRKIFAFSYIIII